MLEILRNEFIEIIIGSIKTTTFRVGNGGKNYAIPKVTGTWGNPLILAGASSKWGSLNNEEKNYWENIKKLFGFRTRYTAFMSSFLVSVQLYGLSTTLLNDLVYHASDNRYKRYRQYQYSFKRRNRLKDYEPDYVETEKVLATLPIDLTSPCIVPKMLTYMDVNLALDCRLVYRTDLIQDSKYSKHTYGTGPYGGGRRLRDRIDLELYEHFDGYSISTYGTGTFGKAKLPY